MSGDRPLILSTEVETATGHRLMEYNGKCAHPHGHNYRWIVEVCAPVIDRRYGLAIDFSDLKAALKAATDIFDHSFVLRQDDPLSDWLVENQNRLVLLNCNPTAENLSQFIADEIWSLFPSAVWANVSCWETSKCMVNARAVHDRFVLIESVYHLKEVE